MQVLIWCLWALTLSAGAVPAALDVEYVAAEGTLHLVASSLDEFALQAVGSAPDILYPNGRMLARLSDASGVVITLSFDETHTLDRGERRAFREVTAEQALNGSANHAVRVHGAREWIYQVFAAPSDYVLTAQTFVEGHPLAVVFWLPSSGEHPLEERRVAAFLDALQVRWEPFVGDVSP